MTYSGTIPLRYKDAEISSLPPEWQEELHPVALRYNDRSLRNGTLFMGPNGIGKTYAAVALTRALQRSGLLSRPAAYVEAASLITLWNEWDHYRDQPFKDTLLNAPFLIFDDLGKEDRSRPERAEAATMRIGQVFRTRSQRGLPLIVTTNLDDRERQLEVYGPSVTSLLDEMVQLELSGPDRRNT